MVAKYLLYCNIIRGSFFVYCACLGMLVKSGGTGFRAGIRVPTHEHGLIQVIFLKAAVNGLAGCY
jgi:hypothetical protein